MKYVLTITMLCLGLQMTFAQEVYNSSGKPGTKKHKESSAKGYDPSKLIFGGDFGLLLGTNTNVGISPMVGYRFTDKLAAGIGLGYSYTNLKDYWHVYDPNTGQSQLFPFKASVVYPSLWARYNISRSVFAMAQFEYDFISAKEYGYDSSYTNIVSSDFRVGVPCLLVGVGVRQQISERVSFVFSIMYDVLQQDYSPYKSDNLIDALFLRPGILVGF